MIAAAVVWAEWHELNYNDTGGATGAAAVLCCSIIVGAIITVQFWAFTQSIHNNKE